MKSGRCPEPPPVAMATCPFTGASARTMVRRPSARLKACGCAARIPSSISSTNTAGRLISFCIGVLPRRRLGAGEPSNDGSESIHVGVSDDGPVADPPPRATPHQVVGHLIGGADQEVRRGENIRGPQPLLRRELGRGIFALVGSDGAQHEAVDLEGIGAVASRLAYPRDSLVDDLALAPIPVEMPR